MSLPPHREPFLLNKFLDAESQQDYEFRRPCLHSKNFCDYEFFRRMNIKDNFVEARFPRFKHADFLYKLPDCAVTQRDADDAKERGSLSPRGHGPGKTTWGMTIDNHHCQQRTAFPERMRDVEGNKEMMNSGPAVFKTVMDNLANGSRDLSFRRLRYMEKSKGGKTFETRARDEKWNRFREGAGPITRTKFLNVNEAKARYGTFRVPGAKSVPQLPYWSDSGEQSRVTTPPKQNVH
ncbi:unnamed protein product [Amoebophrya sp. A120]|nr:unnamed protein product [Amoebophrya sp. A120]|eukprot:GSA120T00001843001.1